VPRRKPAPPTFGSSLRGLREAGALTLADLGDAAGLSRQRVHQLEAGTHRPRWDEVQALAAALSVSTDTFRDPA
jgi:transcriptional regulator with XRE-family HTH domain